MVSVNSETSNDDTEGSQPPPPRKPDAHPDDPHRLAEINLQYYEANYGGRLAYWRDEWWKYRDGCYKRIEDSELQAKVTASIKREFDSLWAEEYDRYVAWVKSDKWDQAKDKGEPKVRPVKRSVVINVIDALKSICLLSSSIELETWLPNRERPRIISMKNGLLKMYTGLYAMLEEERGEPPETLMPHSPDWFSNVKLPYEYDKYAKCPLWLATLSEYFPNDYESIDFLQQWFGYHLQTSAEHHKIAIIVGPARSGKGTINKVLKSLIGERNCCNPTLADLGDRFGGEVLMGKRAAFISDARIGRTTDAVAVGERLLSIAGGDAPDIQRKHRTTLESVPLNVRFTVFTNEVPTLYDSSGALASRFVAVQMTKSFLDHENKGLFRKLEKELPGILNWSLKGLKKLESAGKFTEPESGKVIIADIREITSPIQSFVADVCEISNKTKNEYAEKDDLFEQWRKWCESQGRKPGTASIFFRDLYAAYQVKLAPGRATKKGTTPATDPCQTEIAKRVNVVNGIKIVNWIVDPYLIPLTRQGSRQGYGRGVAGVAERSHVNGNAGNRD